MSPSALPLRSRRTPATRRSWRTRRFACVICRTPPAAFIVLNARTNSPTPAASISESRANPGGLGAHRGRAGLGSCAQLGTNRSSQCSLELNDRKVRAPLESRVHETARGSFGQSSVTESRLIASTIVPVVAPPTSVSPCRWTVARIPCPSRLNRRDAREVEQDALLRAGEGRRAPVSHKLTNSGPCELTVKSNSRDGRIRFQGDHEHRGTPLKLPRSRQITVRGDRLRHLDEKPQLIAAASRLLFRNCLFRTHHNRNLIGLRKSVEGSAVGHIANWRST